MITNYFNTENENKINDCSFQYEASVLVEEEKSNLSSNCFIVQGGEPSGNVNCPFSLIISDTNSFPNDHIIITVGTDQLTVGELKRFLPRQYISSQNIDIYFRIMCNADNMDSFVDPLLQSSYFFSCMFISKIAQGYESSKRWTRNINLFEYKYVFIPVNLSNEHWVLIVMDIELKIVKYYDSYHGIDYS